MCFWDAHAIVSVVITMKNNELTKEVARKITVAMRDARISYSELAARTGIPKSALQRYATAATEKLPLDRLEKIAKALDISAAYLMGWEDEPPEDEDKKNSAPELSESALKLLDIIDRLSPENQQVMLKFAKVLLQERADD